MYSRNRFQYEAATGRTTLLAVAVVTVVLWTIISIPQWSNLGSLLCAGLTAYLLQETDTRFALIRTRTSLPSSLLLLFWTAFTFIHSWSVMALLPACFICILYALFHSYESPYASVPVFHAFLWLGLGSLLSPCFSWLIPFIYLHMVGLRSLNTKTFFAGLIGFMLPYWFLFGYYLYTGEEKEMINLIASLHSVDPFRYAELKHTEWVSWGATLLLSVVYVILYFQNAYKDKVQTRIMLKSMFLMGLWIHLIIAVQPHLLSELLPVALIPGVMAGGHLFALTFNRLTHILFITTLIIWVLLFVFNLWIPTFTC